jgi:hypothetical protein
MPDNLRPSHGVLGRVNHKVYFLEEGLTILDFTTSENFAGGELQIGETISFDELR